MRVLLVEDNERDARVVSELIAKTKTDKFELECVERLSLARSRLAEDRFDVVLLDLSLPDSQGLNGCVEILDQAPAIPIVILTALDDEDLAIRAVQQGAQDYPVKGRIDISLLSRSLRYAIERTRAAEQRTAELVAANQQLQRQIVARQQLETEQARLAAILEATSDFVGTIDANGRVVYVNRAGRQMVGMGENDDVANLSIWDFHPASTNELLKSDMLPSASRDGLWVGEIDFLHSDGRTIPASCVVVAQKTAAGKVEYYSTISRDLSERKRAAEEVRQHQEALAHLNRLSTLGEMAAGLAHELNQPLAAIVGYNEGILEKARLGNWTANELTEVLEKSVAQAKRGGEIIKRLRNLVSKRPTTRSPIDMNDVVQGVSSILQSEAHARQVRLRLELAARLPLVEADQIQIEQVLLNLVQNGFESMANGDPEHRELVVETALNEQGEIAVGIADRGSGGSLEHLDRLFEPFFTTRPAGLGMGLTISRSMIEANDGRLAVAPNSSGGLTFRFTLSAIGAGSEFVKTK